MFSSATLRLCEGKSLELTRRRHELGACATMHPRLIRVHPWPMKNSADPVHPVKKPLSTGLTG